jgi:hypothetical protein
MLKFYQLVIAILILLAFISYATDCTGSNGRILGNISQFFSAKLGS